ncbi:hypothetical protein HHI36_016902 [Cryptolaemus montrouzieri]|uniref:Uncharacterized protein n=1 Tax=Cryptolaemus montrouzieri TaxID=559131 RepID=A0ABD2NLT3_9CUCU
MREWMGALGLVVSNVGNRPTFVRCDQKSTLDISIVSEEREDRIRNWRVLEEEETLSLHRKVIFEISENSNVNGEVVWKIPDKYRWNNKSWNHSKWVETWKSQKRNTNGEGVAEVTKMIQQTNVNG